MTFREPSGILFSEVPPPLRGVYFLISCGEVVYVGQAEDAHLRIRGHQREATKDFDSYAVVPLPAGPLNDLEAEMILRYQPRHNSTVPSNAQFVRADRVLSLARNKAQALDALAGVEPFARFHLFHFGDRNFPSVWYRTGDVRAALPSLAKRI